jgi:ketosteroid isomerase-like protein
MSQENVEIHRRLQARIDAGDIEGQLEFIHPEIEILGRDFDWRVLRGREGWRELDARDHELFDEWRFEVEEYIDAGEYLIVIGRARGRGRSSGVRLEEVDAGPPSVYLWRFRDGMGIECRECRTKEEALEAAGLAE